jgi:hypothetical protein
MQRRLEETACKGHSSISPIQRDLEAAIPVPHNVSVELKELSLLEGNLSGRRTRFSHSSWRRVITCLGEPGCAS